VKFLCGKREKRRFGYVPAKAAKMECAKNARAQARCVSSTRAVRVPHARER
jgi:hypothetical protein